MAEVGNCRCAQSLEHSNCCICYALFLFSSFMQRRACKCFLGSDQRVGIVHANWTAGPHEHVGPIGCTTPGRGLSIYVQVARLCVADLSVDSLQYNGMTTATDSLWAGVPLVTTPGHTMCVLCRDFPCLSNFLLCRASRLASSLLLAAGYLFLFL